MYKKKIELEVTDIGSKATKALLTDDINRLVAHIIEVNKHLAVVDKLLEERKTAVYNLENKDMSIEEYGFSARIRNCLGQYDITSSKQLRELSLLELYKMRGLGKASIDEIIATLKDFHSDYNPKDKP